MTNLSILLWVGKPYERGASGTDKKVEKVDTEGGTPFLIECYNALC